MTKTIGSIIVRQAAKDGEPGISVTNVVRYYLATSVGSGISTETAGWTTTPQSPTVTNKYLWTYDKTYFSNSTTSVTTPSITGVYGDTGYTYRLRGMYESGNTYIFSLEYRDIILYEIGGAVRAFRVKTAGLSVSVPPTSISGDANWDPANELKFIATELVMAQNAIINFLQGNKLLIKDNLGNIAAGLEAGDFPFWVGANEPSSAPFRLGIDGYQNIGNGAFEWFPNGLALMRATPTYKWRLFPDPNGAYSQSLDPENGTCCYSAGDFYDFTMYLPDPNDVPGIRISYLMTPPTTRVLVTPPVIRPGGTSNVFFVGPDIHPLDNKNKITNLTIGKLYRFTSAPYFNNGSYIWYIEDTNGMVLGTD